MHTKSDVRGTKARARAFRKTDTWSAYDIQTKTDVHRTVT